MKKYPAKQFTTLLAASLFIIIFVYFITNEHKQNQKNTTPVQNVSIPDNFKITLSTATIDTRKQDININDILKSEPAAINLFIVQFDGPILEQWKSNVSKYGYIIGYVPNNGLIVRTQTKNINVIKNIQHIQWLGYFQPNYKYYKNLLNSKDPEQKIVLTILTTPQGNIKEIITGIEKVGGKTTGNYIKNGGNLEIEIANGKIPDIAEIKDVTWIEAYIEPQLLN